MLHTNCKNVINKLLPGRGSVDGWPQLHRAQPRFDALGLHMSRFGDFPPAVRVDLVHACMQVATQALPHVSSCWTRRKCRVSPGSALPSTPEMDSRLVLTGNSLSPDLQGMAARRQLRNCTECWGCSTQLHRLPVVKVAGIRRRPDVGMSDTHVFLAGKSHTANTLFFCY